MARFVRTMAGLAVLPALLCGAGEASGQPLRQSFELTVPGPPAPFTVAGTTRLAWELHATNLAATDLELTRLDVLDAASGQPLATFTADDLARILGATGPAERPHTVAPGMRTVAYFWIALDPSRPSPDSLMHRLGFRANAADTEPVTLTAASVAVGSTEPVVLGPPLRGGPWVAAYDPMMPRGHRRVLLALDGAVRIPARFAIDWMKVDSAGDFASGDASRVANWHGYGEDVLAVSDATVAAMRDDLPESATVERRAHALEDGSGNYITLDLGAGRFVTYGHLRPGSIRVRIGERVREGQVIAAVGYTGSAGGPQLHMHVSDGAKPLAGEGAPYVIRAFEVLGAYPSIGDIGERAWTPRAASESGMRRSEMPAPNVVVRFGPGGAGTH